MAFVPPKDSETDSVTESPLLKKMMVDLDSHAEDFTGKEKEEAAEDHKEALRKPHDLMLVFDLRRHQRSMVCTEADIFTCTTPGGMPLTSAGISRLMEGMKNAKAKKEKEESIKRAGKAALDALNEQLTIAKEKLKQTPNGEVDWGHYAKKHGVNVERRKGENDESLNIRREKELRKKMLNADGSIKDEYRDSDLAQYLSLLEQQEPWLKYSDKEFEKFKNIDAETQEALAKASRELENANGQDAQEKQQLVKAITNKEKQLQLDVVYNVTKKKDQNPEESATSLTDISKETISNEEDLIGGFDGQFSSLPGMGSSFAAKQFPADSKDIVGPLKETFTMVANPPEKTLELQEGHEAKNFDHEGQSFTPV